MLMKTPILLLATVLLGACSHRTTTTWGQEYPPGPLQKSFEQLHGRATDDDYNECESSNDEPSISEISIERTFCYENSCAAYTLTLFNDGRVEYLGVANVEHLGLRRGTMEPYHFQKLARTAVGIGFFDLKNRYLCGLTDHPTVYVAITRAGERKIIQHYAPSVNGPASLRLLEVAIDEVTEDVRWASN